MADFGKYYRAYMYMQDLLKNDFTYNYIIEGFKDGDKGNDTLDGKTNEKVIDMDWVEAIEETIPYIQKAIDEQRRFIKQVDNIVRVELAKKVGPESVKHLAQHTNFIAKVEGDMVTPNKVLTIEREESFAIYENRVLMTLIRKALHFVEDKYSKMKDVPNDSYNNIQMTRHVEFNEKQVDFTLSYINDSHETLADNLDVLDVTQLSDFDRIRRIRIVLMEFLNTQLIREISKEPEVRPPLVQTNLLKKNPNFKKAVELWNFLESYKRKGFEIVSEEYSGTMSEEVQQDAYFAMGFQHFMMTIATNPALRAILQEKYEEENKRLAEESARPEKAREALIQAQIDEIRKEEMEIRLREIRDREKKILDLTNEIKNLKITLEQKEQQILTLRGQVSALQDQIQELKAELQETKMKLLAAENEIKELKAENQALKEEIERLNGVIDELNEKIESLSQQIIVLNDRIQVLMQENANMRTKIKEQEALIAEQKARIEELEVQTAEQLAKIAALTETLAQRDAEIEENNKKITYLTQKTESLTNTLENERQSHKDTVAKMNDDFEEKTLQAENAHKAEVKGLQTKLDNADAAHAQAVAQMNAEFADKSNLAEQKRIQDLKEQQTEFESQIDKIKKSNADAATAVSAKHASEIKKVQKSVDKRVEAAEKAAEKRMREKVAEIKRNSQNEIRKAEKKANDKANAAREQAKAVKSSVEVFSRDYSFGSMSVITSYAQTLAKQSTDNLAAKLSTTAKNIKALTVSTSKKGTVLSLYAPNYLKVVKLYKKGDSLEAAIADIPEQLTGLSDAPVVVTYSGVEKSFADKFYMAVKSAVGQNVTLTCNKSLKSEAFIAIYFSKE